MVEVLQGTLFSWVYNILRVSGDDQLINRMTIFAIIYTVVVAFVSIFMPAPYGRYSGRQSRFAVNATVAWIIQECPAFFVPLVLIVQTPCSMIRENDGNKIALLFFMAHYFNRSFIFPFRVINSKPVPIFSCLMAFLFSLYNGLLQGMFLANFYAIKTTSFTVYGMGIFMTGMAINIYYDGVLIGLRKSPCKKTEGKSEYKIPRGGLFELISGANYFGEIVEWWGMFVITNGLPQLTFAVFSTLFLGLRAIHHHQWYKQIFGSTYPMKRKAILPYVL